MDRRKEDKKIASDSQHARFLKTARALGCDEDEAAFNEKLKAIARPIREPQMPLRKYKPDSE